MLSFAEARVAASGNASVAMKILIVKPMPPRVPVAMACPFVALPGRGAPENFVMRRTLP